MTTTTAREGDVSEPTLGEVLRRLDEVSRQMTTLAGEMRAERAENAKTYLRADVYKAEYTASIKRLEIVENDADAKEKAADQFRRQVFLAVITLAIPLVFTLVLAINNFLATGGQVP